jgi:hypothetical protein
MEENPEVPATAKDCRDTQTIPFCVERRGRGICPHFEWSGDDCDSPNTCRHLGELEVDKARYNIDVDGEGVSHVMLRTCYRTAGRTDGPHWLTTMTGAYAKIEAGAKVRAALLMVRFSELTAEGQIRALDIFDLLLEVPRFRKPEPEPRPAPTVRLPF